MIRYHSWTIEEVITPSCDAGDLWLPNNKKILSFDKWEVSWIPAEVLGIQGQGIRYLFM